MVSVTKFSSAHISKFSWMTSKLVLLNLSFNKRSIAHRVALVVLSGNFNICPFVLDVIRFAFLRIARPNLVVPNYLVRYVLRSRAQMHRKDIFNPSLYSSLE